MREIHIKREDSILIVAPHPDDECIGAGGILAKYPLQCDVIVLTDGRQGQGASLPEIEREIRAKEFADEMKRAGIDNYRMLGIEDGTLLWHTDCMNNIDLSTYTKIFVTDIHDDHPDHVAASRCVLNALWLQKNTYIEVYCYEVHTPMHAPTHYLDITDAIDEKKRFIRYHQSQLKEIPYDLLAEYSAKYRAILSRMPERYIEVYCLSSLTGAVLESSTEIEYRLQQQNVHNWVMVRWLTLVVESSNVAKRLMRKGFYEAAIYGYGNLGRLLVKEFMKEGIDIPYVMDRRAGQIDETIIPVVYPNKELKKPMAVVVTVVLEYGKIQAELTAMGFQNVFSLRRLVEEI